jgi:hypothetical protein
MDIVSKNHKVHAIPSSSCTISPQFCIAGPDPDGSSIILEWNYYYPSAQTLNQVNWAPQYVEPTVYYQYVSQSNSTVINGKVYIPVGPVAYADQYENVSGYNLFLGELGPALHNHPLNNTRALGSTTAYVNKDLDQNGVYDYNQNFYIGDTFYQFSYDRHYMYDVWDKYQAYNVYALQSSYTIKSTDVTKWTSHYTVINNTLDLTDNGKVNQMYISSQMMKDNLISILINTIAGNPDVENDFNNIIYDLTQMIFDSTLSTLIGLAVSPETAVLIEFSKLLIDMSTYTSDQIQSIHESNSIGDLFQAIYEGNIATNKFIVLTYTTSNLTGDILFYDLSVKNSYYGGSYYYIPSNYFFWSRNSTSDFNSSTYNIDSTMLSKRLYYNQGLNYGTFTTSDDTDDFAYVLHDILFDDAKHYTYFDMYLYMF